MILDTDYMLEYLSGTSKVWYYIYAIWTFRFWFSMYQISHIAYFRVHRYTLLLYRRAFPSRTWNELCIKAKAKLHLDSLTACVLYLLVTGSHHYFSVWCILFPTTWFTWNLRDVYFMIWIKFNCISKHKSIYLEFSDMLLCLSSV